MPPLLSTSATTAPAVIWLLLVVVGFSSAQDDQGSMREFFGIPYKHPVTSEIEAARAQAYDDMLWIQGVMSGSIIFLFLAGLYSLIATAGESHHTAMPANGGQKMTSQSTKKVADNDERLLRVGSGAFEVE